MSALSTKFALILPTVGADSDLWGGYLNTSLQMVDNYLGDVVNGRLTLTSGTPIMTSDVTAATTLYFTPYKGNRIALYDGVSAWTVLTFTETSIAIPASTNQMYDVFGYSNAGTLALELLAWTNDTTRATAIASQNGVPVKTGQTTRRLLGSVRTTGVSGQTEFTLRPTPASGGTANKLFLCNAYNRVPVRATNRDSADSWTYTTAAFRAMNNNANNAIAWVACLPEGFFRAQASQISTNGAASIARITGIGIDATNAMGDGCLSNWVEGAAGDHLTQKSEFVRGVTIGYHYVCPVEYSVATNTTTWSGDGGNANIIQAGSTLELEM